MPSALLKTSQPAAQQITAMDSQDPLKNAVLLLEKKVRNLEKRRGRIEGYEKLAADGTTLNEDQKASLLQKEFLGHNLDMVRELHKQMGQLCDDHHRQHKKEQKRAKQEQKEQAHKESAQTISKVIQVRYLLDSLTEDVRGDFLSGINGACQLTEDDFAKLDGIYKLINPTEDEDVTISLATKIESSCSHLQNLVDAKEKAILDSTYCDIYKVLNMVNDCGYFSKTENAEQEEEPAAEETEAAAEPAVAEVAVEVPVVNNGAPSDLAIAEADLQLQRQSQMNAGSPEFVPRQVQSNTGTEELHEPVEEAVPQQQADSVPEENGDDGWKVSGGEQGRDQGSRHHKPRDGRGRGGGRGGGFGRGGGRGGRGGRGGHDNRPHNGTPREGGQQRRGGPPREGGYRGGRGGSNRDQQKQQQQQQ